MKPIKNSLEDLKIWQKSMDLSHSVAVCIKKSSEFSLRNQILRSAISIPSNIAEGYGRAGNKEFIRYLKIAKGSANELKTQLLIAGRLNEISAIELHEFTSNLNTLIAMIQSMINARMKMN